MYGSTVGNVVGISYFFLYQILGYLFARQYIRKENAAFQLLIGSITGSVALHWLPTITSMIMDFTVASHIVALVLYVTIFGLIMYVVPVKKKVLGSEQQRDSLAVSMKKIGQEIKNAPVFTLIMVATFIFYWLLLASHTIPIGEYGEARTGQCGYGDMNMHLGFITSIANQQTFPPDYSLLPGTKLAYPFLCDSISSSVYVFGASLRVAFMLPMLVAILQVFLGFYCLAKVILKSKAKSLLAWVLFIFNGGLGILYFLDTSENPENFSRIFTAFYETPTNYVDKNIRWVNVIADMLLPQRATLFGWAVLFGTLALLYRAMEEKKTSYFVLAAIFGGALPLIHTHSFLALAMICVVWVTGYMHELAGYSVEGMNKIMRILLPVGIIFMCMIQKQQSFLDQIATTGFAMVGLLVAVAVGVIGFYLYKLITRGLFVELFVRWGSFLVIVLVLALPQLINWTFKQVGNGSGSLRGHFNWGNIDDQYMMFYMKNIGIMVVIAVIALIVANKKKLFMAGPALFIWGIAEFIVFQPNVYDNNKLLYVAYALLVILSADFLGDCFVGLAKKKETVAAAYILAGMFLVVCTISGILTLGREYVSGREYELYSADQMAVCEFIEENVEADAVILTNTRHNNAIASLTGRNIVCGSGTFLYFHGLDYSQQEADVQNMYTAPSIEMLHQYNVSYFLIGPDERGSYAVDEATLQTMGELVFSQNDVQLYKVYE